MHKKISYDQDCKRLIDGNKVGPGAGHKFFGMNQIEGSNLPVINSMNRGKD